MSAVLSAILWDNDGTLVDTEPLYFHATREVLAEVGVELTEEWFVRLSLDEGRSAFDLALAHGVEATVIERLRRERNERYERRLAGGVPLRPGIVECLQKFAGKVRMGIVTSCLRTHFTRMHERTGLLPYFDFVLTQEDYERTKPDPAPYLAAARRHGLDPDRCLVIEDTRRGLLSAKRAGMQCWVLPTSFVPAGGFPEADRVLSGARELEAAVLALL
jgi:HAD superfamily hydrolase (TIGR01509 family)